MTGHSRREEKGSPREDGERPGEVCLTTSMTGHSRREEKGSPREDGERLREMCLDNINDWTQ